VTTVRHVTATVRVGYGALQYACRRHGRLRLWYGTEPLRHGEVRYVTRRSQYCASRHGAAHGHGAAKYGRRRVMYGTLRFWLRYCTVTLTVRHGATTVGTVRCGRWAVWYATVRNRHRIVLSCRVSSVVLSCTSRRGGVSVRRGHGTVRYKRVAQRDLPTLAPGPLQISPRPQMEGKGGKDRGSVFTWVYRNYTIQGQTFSEINGNQAWQIE
jgi:hypothetical protein